MLVGSGQATVAGLKGLLFQIFAPGLGAGRRNFVSGFRFHCQLPPKTGEPFAARLDIVDGATGATIRSFSAGSDSTTD